MKLGLCALLAASAIALVASGAAEAGWAGSIYQKSDCSFTKPTAPNANGVLRCNTTVTDRFPNTTEQTWVADPNCTSGYRIIERTGTRVEVSWVFDLYAGHTPLAKNNIGGDNGLLSVSWEDFTDRDIGCAPA